MSSNVWSDNGNDPTEIKHYVLMRKNCFHVLYRGAEHETQRFEFGSIYFHMSGEVT